MSMVLGDNEKPLTERELQLVSRVFSDPTAFPVGYRAWLKGLIELEPPTAQVTAIEGGVDWEDVGTDVPGASGLQFDTYPQVGDWFYAEVNNRVGAPYGRAFEIRDRSIGGSSGIEIRSDESKIDIDAGGQLAMSANDQIDMTAFNSDVILRTTGYHSIRLDSQGQILLTAPAGGIYLATNAGVGPGGGDIDLNSGGTIDLSAVGPINVGTSAGGSLTLDLDSSLTTKRLMHFRAADFFFEGTQYGTDPINTIDFKVNVYGKVDMTAYTDLSIVGRDGSLQANGGIIQLAGSGPNGVQIVGQGSSDVRLFSTINGNVLIMGHVLGDGGIQVPILKVTQDSLGQPTYHIKTGASWVADL